MDKRTFQYMFQLMFSFVLNTPIALPPQGNTYFTQLNAILLLLTNSCLFMYRYSCMYVLICQVVYSIHSLLILERVAPVRFFGRRTAVRTNTC